MLVAEPRTEPWGQRTAVASDAARASPGGGDGVGLRRKLYQLLGGGRGAPPETSTEPVEIGYVPLWHSQILAMRLREDGFHAHAVDETRADPMGRIPLQPMAHIYVPKREAAAARDRLDELSAG